MTDAYVLLIVGSMMRAPAAMGSLWHSPALENWPTMLDASTSVPHAAALNVVLLPNLFFFLTLSLTFLLALSSLMLFVLLLLLLLVFPALWLFSIWILMLLVLLLLLRFVITDAVRTVAPALGAVAHARTLLHIDLGHQRP